MLRSNPLAFNPEDDQVRLSGEIREPGFFNVGRGVAIDLRECTGVTGYAATGLLPLLRDAGRVVLRMLPGSQPARMIAAHYPAALRYCGGADWELLSCSA